MTLARNLPLFDIVNSTITTAAQTLSSSGERSLDPGNQYAEAVPVLRVFRRPGFRIGLGAVRKDTIWDTIRIMETLD